MPCTTIKTIKFTRTKGDYKMKSLQMLENVTSLTPSIDSVELFNQIQESSPINDIIGKNFTFLGFIPEMVDVKVEKGVENVESSNEYEEKLKLYVFTDIGVFHSYSITFNSSVEKAVKIFGSRLNDIVFNATSKTKNNRVSYTLKVVDEKCGTESK